MSGTVFRVYCIYPKKEIQSNLIKKWRKTTQGWFCLSGSIQYIIERVVTWPCCGCMQILAVMSCLCLSLSLVEIVLSIQRECHHPIFQHSHSLFRSVATALQCFQSWIGITVQSFIIASLACKSFDWTTSEWWKASMMIEAQYNLCWIWWKLQAAITHHPFIVGASKDSCECWPWLDLEQWLLMWNDRTGSKTSMGMTWQPKFACNHSKNQVKPILQTCPHEPLHSQEHSKLNVRKADYKPL